MHHMEDLEKVQQDIKRSQVEMDELLKKRSRIILEARDGGLTNRQIAQALDVHESHVYRMIKK